MVTFGSVQGSSFSPVALGVMRALNESHSIESSAHQLPCLFVPSLTSSRLQAYVCSGIHHLRWRKSCEITKAVPGWSRKVGIAVVRRYILLEMPSATLLPRTWWLRHTYRTWLDAVGTPHRCAAVGYVSRRHPRHHCGAFFI